MPCNGFGHALDCECGWGGEFFGNEGFRYSLQHWQRLDSHTNPNAKCPRCGANVFFYRSPDGGCVFFDELGSPWPKHECLHADEQPKPHPLSSGRRRHPTWPFVWMKKWPLPNKEGTLLSDVDDRLLIVRTNWLKIPLWTPIWLSRHPTVAGRYRASLPRVKDGNVSESAYDAYTVESLGSIEHAKLFQATIKNFNSEAK